MAHLFQKEPRSYHFFQPKCKCEIKNFTNILLQHHAHLHFQSFYKKSSPQGNRILFHSPYVTFSIVRLSKQESRFDHLLKSRYIQEKKSFPNIFVFSTTMWVVHSGYGKIIRTHQWGFVYTVFVEFFTAHLSKTKSRFYHFLKLTYMRMSHTFYNTMRISTFNHLNKSSQQDDRQFFSSYLCRTSNAASFKKKSRLSCFLQSRYMQNKKVF
jgi:hypothetical protein